MSLFESTLLIQITTYKYEKITMLKTESTVDIHRKKNAVSKYMYIYIYLHAYIYVCMCIYCIYVYICMCIYYVLEFQYN